MLLANDCGLILDLRKKNRPSVLAATVPFGHHTWKHGKNPTKSGFPAISPCIKGCAPSALGAVKKSLLP
jgi:hypothetical protein